LFGLFAAGGGAEVFVEFFDFEEVENLLGFEDAVLFEQEIGEVAIGIFDQGNRTRFLTKENTFRNNRQKLSNDYI
jgi:hypothetical protein